MHIKIILEIASELKQPKFILNVYSLTITLKL